jgi:hypothetical protein
MCQSASFVLTEAGVYWSVETDSHESIGEKFDLPLWLAGRSAVVFVEAHPTAGLEDWPAWEVVIDTPEDELPAWFDDDRQSHLNRVAREIPRWVRAKFLPAEGGGLRVVGNMNVSKWSEGSLRNVSEVDGYLFAPRLTEAPLLKKVGGKLTAQLLTKAPLLQEVGGSLSAPHLTKAPLLQEVGESLLAGRLVEAPVLEQVGGRLSASKLTEAPMLLEVGENMWVESLIEAPMLQKVGGELYAHHLTRAPMLQEVGDDLYAPHLTKANAPMLREVDEQPWSPEPDDDEQEP